MKITLTGAAGKLGIHVCRALVEAGHEVRGIDQVTRHDLPIPIEIVDLLHREVCYKLLEGADAVVHLANHPHEYMRDKQRLLTENLAMNTNIFQAACELGVKNIVFSSSIQALGVGRREGDSHSPSLAYLPIDGNLPAQPTNVYGLSKQLSEEMLRYYARESGMNCIASRFPFLSDGIPQVRPESASIPTDRINEAWSYLSLRDASTLIVAILAASLTGFRIYCPAARSHQLSQSAASLAKDYFRDIPLKNSAERINSFFDVSRITDEIGWLPKDELSLSYDI